MFFGLDLMGLQIYWWGILSLLGGLLVFMFFVQGGQGMLFELAKNEEEKALIVNSLGRKWELGFTTLVLFGGASFAAFPLFYSTSFGGAYWVWLIILFCFIVQAVSYEYRKKEFEAGKISEIDMQQAKSEMASVRAQLQSLLMERNSAQTSLLILLGRDPQGIFNVELPTEAQMLPKAPKVPTGLPSTLLEQRPDIEMATQNLKAANFSIGVARAAYFPTISLTGLVGYVSPELNELFQSSSSTWNYGGTFVGNVIDFGRTSANVELSKSQYREMLLNYGNTVRQAFGEVRNYLYNYGMSDERLKSLDEQVEALRRTLVLAEMRYKEGYTNYLEVLTTQSNLFAAELTQQSANLENLSAVINLYKAFGGGWDKSKYAQEE